MPEQNARQRRRPDLDAENDPSVLDLETACAWCGREHHTQSAVTGRVDCPCKRHIDGGDGRHACNAASPAPPVTRLTPAEADKVSALLDEWTTAYATGATRLGFDAWLRAAAVGAQLPDETKGAVARVLVAGTEYTRRDGRWQWGACYKVDSDLGAALDALAAREAVVAQLVEEAVECQAVDGMGARYVEVGDLHRLIDRLAALSTGVGGSGGTVPDTPPTEG